MPRDYENKSQMRMTQDSANAHRFPSKYHSSHPPTLSYQPAMSGSRPDYKNTSTSNSCAVLPDDYLQCTKAEQELSMSAQWFQADDSNSALVIELEPFLDSKDIQAAPTTKSISHVDVHAPIVEHTEPVITEEDSTTKHSDVKHQMKSVVKDSTDNNIPQTSNDNNNYCKIIDYLPQPTSQPISRDTQIDVNTTPMELVESSSGDSGYVDRTSNNGVRCTM